MPFTQKEIDLKINELLKEAFSDNIEKVKSIMKEIINHGMNEVKCFLDITTNDNFLDNRTNKSFAYISTCFDLMQKLGVPTVPSDNPLLLINNSLSSSPSSSNSSASRTPLSSSSSVTTDIQLSSSRGSSSASRLTTMLSTSSSLSSLNSSSLSVSASSRSSSANSQPFSLSSKPLAKNSLSSSKNSSTSSSSFSGAGSNDSNVEDFVRKGMLELCLNDSPNTEKTRLKEKLENKSCSNKLFNKDFKSRGFTPNTQFMLARNNHVVLLADTDDTTKTIAYSHEQHNIDDTGSAPPLSQTLTRMQNRTIGGSVTSAIQTNTERKHEKKSTFVQYNRNTVNQENKDFSVKATNLRGLINYQGSHIIDHKFSAGNSHTDEINYVPMHFFYNSPLKEYLVKRSDAYIEIILFTPNPPTIGVKNNASKSAEIPIGIIFAQIKDGKIVAAYFFPNDYDYEELKTKLSLTKKIAENIVPYFKLREELYCLLMPAVLVDINTDPNKSSEQNASEKERLRLINIITHGILLEECPTSEDSADDISEDTSEEDNVEDDSEDTSENDLEDSISTLSWHVAHDSVATIKDFLSLGDKEFKIMDQKSLQASFKECQRFLILYGLENALKSEFISITSRLEFINMVIDFIDAHIIVDNETLDVVNNDLAKPFKKYLGELNSIKNIMSIDELFYFANLYKRLAEPANHNISTYNYENLYSDGDILRYTKSFIDIIRALDKKCITNVLNNRMFNLIQLHLDGQEALSYIITLGYPAECINKERLFLKKIKPEILKILKLYEEQNGSPNISESSKSCPSHSLKIRSSINFLRTEADALGTFSSACYGNESSNDESDNETSSSASNSATALTATSALSSNPSSSSNGSLSSSSSSIFSTPTSSSSAIIPDKDKKSQALNPIS